MCKDGELESLFEEYGVLSYEELLEYFDNLSSKALKTGAYDKLTLGEEKKEE